LLGNSHEIPKTKTIFVIEAPRDQDIGLDSRELHHWRK